MVMDKRALCNLLDEKAEFLNKLSDRIWESPELAFREQESAGALIEALEQEGFAVERNVAGIETAFLGRFGNGSPVIGMLGEFDALTGLSQAAGLAEKQPLDGAICGHGCGHNNLGVGALAAAIGVKEYLQATGMSGTVIYYGCPGEEGGSGKAFMAREGMFESWMWHSAGIRAV